MLKPHLGLGDVRWNIADDARHVFVENMCGDARLLQAVQQQVGVEPVNRGVKALHLASTLVPSAP